MEEEFSQYQGEIFLTIGENFPNLLNELSYLAQLYEFPNQKSVDHHHHPPPPPLCETIS